MKQISTLSLMRVPKEKFPELTTTLIQIVDEHDADKMHVKITSDELKKRSLMLSNIKVTERKHPESKLISSLYSRRKVLIAALVRQAKAVQKADIASQATQLSLVVPFVERYWSNFHRFNESTFSFRTKNMLGEIDSNTVLKDATDTLAMTLILDEIRTIQTTLDNSRDKRRKSRSTSPKIDTRKVKTYVSEAITDLISAIELAVKAYPTIDYSGLINEINQLFTQYQSDIKAHDTRLKNSEEVSQKTDNPTTNTTDSSDKPAA